MSPDLAGWSMDHALVLHGALRRLTGRDADPFPITTWQVRLAAGSRIAGLDRNQPVQGGAVHITDDQRPADHQTRSAGHCEHVGQSLRDVHAAGDVW